MLMGWHGGVLGRRCCDRHRVCWFSRFGLTGSPVASVGLTISDESDYVTRVAGVVHENKRCFDNSRRTRHAWSLVCRADRTRVFLGLVTIRLSEGRTTR